MMIWDSPWYMFEVGGSKALSLLVIKWLPHKALNRMRLKTRPSSFAYKLKFPPTQHKIQFFRKFYMHYDPTANPYPMNLNL